MFDATLENVFFESAYLGHIQSSRLASRYTIILQKFYSYFLHYSFQALQFCTLLGSVRFAFEFPELKPNLFTFRVFNRLPFLLVDGFPRVKNCG
jgi:hypothetical protein